MPIFSILQKSILDKLASLKAEKANLGSQLDHLTPEIEKVLPNQLLMYLYSACMLQTTDLLSAFCQLDNVIESRSKEIAVRENRINNIVDQIYKSFSESVGVKNIREYEENQLKAVQLMANQKLDLLNQQSKLKYQYALNAYLCCFFFLGLELFYANFCVLK